MALIKCPECGKEISDNAKQCVGCGAPIHKTNKRPIIITILCITMFVLAPYAFITAFTDAAAQVVEWWYPPYSVFCSIIVLICMIGLWKMKKWSVIAYTIFTGITQVVVIVMGVWGIVGLIVPGIVIAIGFSQYKLMK